MKEYNAIEAARILGISDKTVRRHIQKGTIEANRKASGELKIAEDQLDKLRLVLELESESRHEQTGLEDMPRQVKELAAKVLELESRLVYLESLQSQNKPFKYAVDKVDVQPPQSPLSSFSSTNRGTSVPADLPDGTLTSTQFRTQLGIEKVEMDIYIQRGVFGEPFPMTRIPHPTRKDYTLTFFTPSQQEQAIALLRRHGKIQ